MKINKLLSGSIVLPFEKETDAAYEYAAKALKRALPSYNVSRASFSVYRRSADARRRDRIKFVYSILIDLGGEVEADPKILAAEDLKPFINPHIDFEYGDTELPERPLIVGSGPAGMFCALMLAENGYRPILIERGDSLENRVKKVNTFFGGGSLDTETNVMFGAGGAGTFSDGKLVTRINDPLVSYVLSRMNEFGAPDEILYKSKPHVGTDLLRGVVSGLLGKIEELGGNVIYNCRFDSFSETPDGTVSAVTNKGNISSGAVVLALGHSARDTYTNLLDKGLIIEPKPFSVGFRIEHSCEVIDKAMFGDHAGDPRLGHAEYTLSDTSSGRGVYTFCMCPGGQVIAASSETGGVVVNGMSYHARDGRNSNCAVAVSVFPSDHGGTPFSAIAFQREIERKAFSGAGGDYSAPSETVGDFMSGRTHDFSEPSSVLPTYTRKNVKMTDISSLFPEYINSELKHGLGVFGKRISGFDSSEALITAPETRTSSPVRILRGNDYAAPGHPQIYPCGEGAGYAGGITSAAVDGIHVALAIMKKYKRPE